MLHDTLVEAILGPPEHAATALQSIVPAELCNALDWNGLRRENTSYASVDGGSRHSDLIFTVPLRAAADAPPREVLIYVLLEDQGAPDPLMALRLFVYVGRLFQDRLPRADLARAQLVVPVVLSHTEQPWIGAQSLQKLHDNTPLTLLDALGSVVPRLADRVADGTPMPIGPIAERGTVAILEFIVKSLRDERTNYTELVACATPAVELLYEASGGDHLESVSLFECIFSRKKPGPAPSADVPS